MKASNPPPLGRKPPPPPCPPAPSQCYEAAAKELFAWAVEYVESNNDALADCHRHPDGTITEPEVRAEIDEARQWIARARAALA